MNNNLLILFDTFIGIVLTPVGLLFYFFNRHCLRLIRPKPNGKLLIKLLGAGNYLPIKAKLNSKSFDILTVSSNLETLKHFHIGAKIYLISDRNIFTLCISSIRLFFTLLLQNYDQVINLEMESKFAKFLSLITPAKKLSGISSHNKSYLDRIIYDSYLVSPMLLERAEIVSQLVEFKPKVNGFIAGIIHNHQEKFKKKFPSFKSLENITIFPSCSSTDPLRRLQDRDWGIILTMLIKKKNIKNITVIFPTESDIQYHFFKNFLIRTKSNKLNLKLTNFKNFVGWVKRSDLILSVDSQALHIAQLHKKKSIVFYGPTSPFGINLEETTYPICLTLSCSPCTHKYLKLPCGNSAPCMDFNQKHLEILNL
jgi:ADP-heptose:LPS heptosyltransferase